MKKLKVVTPYFIPVLLLSILIYLMMSTKFSDMTCVSQYGECSVLITQKLNGVNDCNYFECRKNIDIVLSDVWIVDKYSYQVKLPLRIEVNLVERKPKYSIKSVSSDLYAQTDSSGLVMNYKDSTSLPGIIFEEDLPRLGEVISTEMLFALELIYGTSKIQGVEKAVLENNHISIDIGSGKYVLLPLSGNRDFILGALTLILGELKKDKLNSKIVGVDSVKTIDLRYKNPILK